MNCGITLRVKMLQLPALPKAMLVLRNPEPSCRPPRHPQNFHSHLQTVSSLIPYPSPQPQVKPLTLPEDMQAPRTPGIMQAARTPEKTLCWTKGHRGHQKHKLLRPECQRGKGSQGEKQTNK